MQTKVIVLGVGHSDQLVSRNCQPAVYRAFFDKVNPDVIAIERSPLEYNRSDFYEFTYEQQNLIIPYAKKKGVTVRPFDWLPSGDDQQLAWNISDIEQTPFIRSKGSYKDFLFFTEATIHEEDFFYADSKECKHKIDKWITTVDVGERDFPRRLFLYRTYMQAMRIKQIAKEYIGKTLLVVVGYMHKNDIENILGGVPYIDIVKPSMYDYPTMTEIEKNIEIEDLFAISTFNVLGVQSQHFVNWEWVKHVITTLEETVASAEVRLLKIRMEVLTNLYKAEEAILQYEQLKSEIEPNIKFTFNGVKDPSRIDSYFDPFGNMPILNRLHIETAREYSKINDFDQVAIIKEILLEQETMSTLKRLQLNAYWDDYVVSMR